MAEYSEERKQAVIEKMMPPHNRSIPVLAKETGISSVTLYHWRKQAKGMGMAVPGDGKNPEHWSAEDKLAVVIETAVLNEAELAVLGAHAERYVYDDPQSALIKLRCFVEKLVGIVYREWQLPSLPNEKFIDRLENHAFTAIVDRAIIDKLHALRKESNPD